MFHVYYDPKLKQYKLRADVQIVDFESLATFKIFDMAYEYITRMNHAGNQQAVYSRWAK